MAQGVQKDERLHLRETDKELLKLLSEYLYLTPLQFAGLTGRPVVSMRARLRQYWRNGLLNRTRLVESDDVEHFNPTECAYFFDEKGATFAAHLGYLDRPRWRRDKSRLILTHDMAITDFHIRLHKALGKKLTFWEQHRAVLKDYADANGERLAIIPDALFTIDDEHSYFLEVVKSRESEYQNGESNIMRKIRAYDNYRPRFQETWQIGDFRVVFILPTEERVQNLLEKMEAQYPHKRFWLTDEAKVNHILKPIFKTPKDHTSKSCGFLDI